MRPAGRLASLLGGLALGACARHRSGDSDRPRPAPSAAASIASAARPAPPAVGESRDASGPRPAVNPYPTDRVLSLLTPPVTRRLKSIASNDPGASDDAFIKVGDSITASGHFLDCFAAKHVDLGAHAGLAPLLARFGAERGGASDPFSRLSAAAGVGWSAWQALRGRPSPLAREVAKLKPRFAFVMYGTNDVEDDNVRRFTHALSGIVDRLSARGVIPILWTVPRRLDQHEKDLRVDRYNAAVRELAESRDVPLVDYHLALSLLPRHGLGRDGIHPSAEPIAQGGACDLSARGLRYGYNLRNLLALEALERVTQALGSHAVPARDQWRSE
jgi:GDSL-like Lipase/Acylhydrolase family